MRLLSSHDSRRRSRLFHRTAATTLAVAGLTFVSGMHWGASTAEAAGLPKVTIVATNSETGEVERSPGLFTISIPEKLDHPLTVVYSVKGTGVNGEDYVRLSGSKVIKAGKEHAQIQVICKQGTQAYFPPETVTLVLVKKNDYTIGAAKRATVTIEYVLP